MRISRVKLHFLNFLMFFLNEKMEERLNESF